MSLYLVVFLLNVLFVYCNDVGRIRFKYGNRTTTADQREFLYVILLVLYGMMLVFRYGQGADYFVYKDAYNGIAHVVARKGLFSLTGQEFGWVLLNKFFSGIGFSFEVFVIVISFVEIILVNKFINTYITQSKCFVLMILMPTFYFTYLFSTLRQGLVMCIYLGCMLPLLEKRRYFWYTVLSFILASIHITAILYLLCILVPLGKKIRTKVYETITVCLMIIGVFLHVMGLYSKLYSFLPYTFYLHAGIDTSIGAIIKRIVLLFLVIYCSHHIEDNKEQIDFMYRLVLIASMLYFLTSGIALLAGRAYALWGDALESLIVAKYVASSKSGIKIPIASFVVAISAYLLFKNINAEIYRSFYIDSVNAFNFPYCSIFNKEMIDVYRSSHYYR